MHRTLLVGEGRPLLLAVCGRGVRNSNRSRLTVVLLLVRDDLQNLHYLLQENILVVTVALLYPTATAGLNQTNSLVSSEVTHAPQ